MFTAAPQPTQPTPTPLLLPPPPPTLTGPVVATWNPPSGNPPTWDIAQNWNPIVPGPTDSAQDNSLIPATINNPETVQNLTVGTGAIVAVVSNSDPTISSSLTVLGTANNAGTIQANSTTTDPTVTFDQAVTIQSGGMTEAYGSEAKVIFSGDTVENLGTISANTSGSVLFQGATATNEAGGLIIAENQGSIVFDSSTVIVNKANGVIEADGTGSGIVIPNGIDNFGTLQANHGSTISIVGTATNENGATVEALNSATITINPTDGENLGTIAADDGTINIILSGNSGNGSGGGGNVGLIEALDGGTVTISEISGASFNNPGTIEANGGLVAVETAITGAGSAIITGGGTLEIGSSDAQTVTFADASTLKLDQPAEFSGQINGLALGDIIDFANNTSITSTSISGSTLTVNESSGGPLTFSVGGALAGNAFVVQSDGHGGTELVLATAAAPTLTAPATLTVGEDGTVALGISETPFNPNDTVSIAITGVPSDATLSAGIKNNDGSWTLTPTQLTDLTLTAGEVSNATLTVTATEAGTASASQNISLTVNPVAEIPILTLGGTTASVNEGSTVVLPSITASGDSDDSVTLTIAGLASGATITDSVDGTVFSGSSFTLTGAEVGSTLTLHDGTNEGNFSLAVTANNTANGETVSSAPQSIALTVNPVAEIPTLTLGGTTASVNEGSTVGLPSITASGDSDDSVTLTIAGLASGATITDSVDGTVFSGSSFTLTGAEVGSTLTLHDGTNAGNFSLTVTANNTTSGEVGSSVPQTIAVTISSIAVPILTLGGTTASVNESGTVALPSITASGDNTLTLTIAGLASGATITDSVDGTVFSGSSFTLTGAEVGSTLTLHDGTNEGNFSLAVTANNTANGETVSSAPQSIALTVNPVAEIPTLTLGGTTASVNEGSTVGLPSITASGDSDDSVTLTIAGLASGATITDSVDGTVFSGSSFTLTGAEVGSTLTLHDGTNADNFSLTVTANNTTSGEVGSSVPQTIAVTISSIAVPILTLGGTTASVNESGTVALPSITASGDNTLTLTIAGLASGATITDSVDGTVFSGSSFTLTGAEVGSTLTLHDGTNEGNFSLAVTANNTANGETVSSAPQSIALTVNPVAEIPTLTLGGTTASVNEGSTVGLPSITASGDSDDSVTLTIAGLASGATITDSVDGTVFSGSSFTLTGAEVGSTLTLHDGTNAGNFSLTVTANNTTSGEVGSSVPQTIAVTISSIAVPILTLGGTTASVNESGTVALPSITASGDNTLTLTIAGLASGATITDSVDGTVFSGSSFTLTGAEVGSTLTLHDGTNEGNFSLAVTANNTANGETVSSAPQSIALTVNPVAEIPTLTLGGTTASVNEGSTVGLPSITASGDSDDSVTLTIAGLASGATITDSVDGTVFSGSSFTLTGAEVGSTLTLHDGTNADNFSLTVTANNTTSGEVGSSVPQTIAVTAQNPNQDDWINPLGGDWATASNWDNGVPISTTIAELNASGTYTVTNSGTVTVAELISTATATLDITGGTFTVTNFAGQGPLLLSGGTLTINSSIGNTVSLTQIGGELNGTGTLTVTGASNFSNGTQSGSGTTVAQGGAAFSSTGFGLDGGRTLQLGGISSATGTSVQISLNSSNPNTGTSDSGSGILTILSGATFNDETTGSGGLQIITVNRGGTDTGTTAAVNNQGTFIKSGAATTSTISSLFNNTGTVNVEAGTLDLSGGGTDVGATYESTTGTGTIEFGGGTRTLDAASSITGNALFSGNATTFTTVNGGVGTGLMTVTAGTATFNGTVTTGGLTQSGGELNGTGTLTVTGASNFSNGTQSGSGTTVAQGGAAFSSTGFGLDGGRTLQLGGISSATGTSVQISLNSSNPNTGTSDSGSGILTILSGATFNDETTGSGGLQIITVNRGGTDTGTTAAVNNQGTFIKSGAATTSTISSLFNNTGTVNVEAGTLDLSGGGTDVGATYESTTGTGTIEFGGGTRTLDAASSITGNALFSGNATTFTTVNGGVGTGLMTVTAGTATFNGTVTTGGLTQSGGELNGTGTLTVTGASNFSNGTQSGSGTTVAQGGAAFSSTGFGLDGGRTLQLGGISSATGTSVQISLNSSNPNTGTSDSGSGILTILSGATFNDETTGSGGLQIITVNRGGTDTGTTAAVNNQGTFIKSGAATTSTISSLFNNTGTVNVEAGTLELAGSVSNGGLLHADGGNIKIDQAITDTGAAMIDGSTLEYVQGSHELITFGAVTGGTLKLDASQSFNGNVAGFVANDTMDLADINFSNSHQATYNSATAILTVTDGTHTANITLQGNYQNAQFTTANDGGSHVDVIVTPVPVNNVPSGPLTAAENTPLAIGGLSVRDVAPAADVITVTLSITNGTLTVLTNVPGGLTSAAVAGNAGSSVTLTGSQSAIDTTLAAANGAVYQGNLNFTGSDNLTMVSKDGSGPTSPSSTVAINVDPTLDPHLWASVNFPSQATPGIHLFNPGLAVNTANALVGLEYASSSNYDPANPTAPQQETEQIAAFDPFFLPQTIANPVIETATVIPPSRSQFMFPSIQVGTKIDAEAIVDFVNQDASGNEVINQSVISGGNNNNTLNITPPSVVENAGQGVTIYNLHSTFQQTNAVLSGYALAWDQFNSAAKTFSINFQTFNADGSQLSSLITPLSLSNVATITAAPAWVFGNGMTVSNTGSYLLGVAASDSTTSASLNLSGPHQALDFQGYSLSGAPSSVSFVIEPDLHLYAPGATNQIVQELVPTLASFPGGPSNPLTYQVVGSNYAVAWNETVTDAYGTHDQVEFVLDNGSSVISRTTFQIADATAQNVRLGTVNLGGQLFEVLVYGDNTATHIVEFNATTGNQVASIIDPTTQAYGAFTVLGDGRIAIGYDEPVDASGTSQYNFKIFDLRTTGININEYIHRTISGTTLTVSGIVGTVAIGDTVSGAGVAANTIITVLEAVMVATAPTQ